MSDACRLIHERLSRLHRFGTDFVPDSLPRSGVYFMFERGEQAHGTDRIVRVGTHRGDDKLRSRLREHFHTPNKDRSIFRKHVGRCILASRQHPFLAQWNLDLTTRAQRERHGTTIDKAKLAAVEQEVSVYMSENVSFAVLEVLPKTDRDAVEQKFLATIVSCGQCQTSQTWLGRFHSDDRVRRSGLWNVQNLGGEPLTAAEAEQLLGPPTAAGSF